jgi:hypothetical protein
MATANGAIRFSFFTEKIATHKEKRSNRNAGVTLLTIL